MKSKNRVWFGLGLLALAATLALWKCADPSTTGSGNYLKSGSILRIMKVEAPNVADGATVVAISVGIKNDKMPKGEDARTDITITSYVLHIVGPVSGTISENDNTVIPPDSTYTLDITINNAAGFPLGKYDCSITVSGINDFGEDVEAKADFTFY